MNTNHVAWRKGTTAGALLVLFASFAPAATNYVWQDSPNPTPPYISWETAAHVIQDAVDEANDGDTVLVTNGVYATDGRTASGSTTNRVAVDKPLELISVNGAEHTIIDGLGSVRCVYLTRGASLSGFTLRNGHSPNVGGGLWCDTPSAVVTSCRLIANSAVHGGGVVGGTLNNCVLSANSAVLLGGGGVGSMMNNCALSGNSASRGGGALAGAFNNCTITGNSALDSGGGVSLGTLNNCIVYFNSAPMDENYALATLNHCCTTPLPTNGIGNISTDPQMVDVTHIGSGSPCINAGSADYTTATDIDGEVWSDPPSIGCDDFVPGSVTGPMDVQILANYTNVVSGFPVQFTALITGRTMGSEWVLGDGLTETNRPYITRAWTAVGSQDVVLRAFNETYPSGICATVTVHIVEQSVHYVDAMNTNPVAPYTSWATATTNIQEAVDATTVPGSLVLVTNGTYASGGRAVLETLMSRVVVDKPVALQSVNGPETTEIVGDGYPRTRCVYLARSASLSGFTLRGGLTRSHGDATYEQSGGGVWCETTDAKISNCVIHGNFAARYGGGAFRGTLNDCVLSGNHSGNYGVGAGAAESVLNGCTLTGNTSNQGAGVHKCKLNNCSLTGNFASTGGGASLSTLNNCVLVGNIAGGGGGAYLSTLNNCVLSSNLAYTDGGAIYRGTINNSTLVGNSAWRKGGGAAWAILNNCIAYHNTAETGPNYWEDRYEPFPGAEVLVGELNHTCTYPLPTNGVGNITIAPLFVDTNNWADLRLSPDSPCTDSGNNDFVTTLTDLDGNPRIINGIVDMGAYEFVPPTPAELVQQLIDLVNESDLQQKQPLLETLNAALASIQRGNCHSAVGQLHAFQNKVAAQVSDANLALVLVKSAGQVVETSGCEDGSQVAARIYSFKRHPNGRMQMTVKGETGIAYILEASTNLVDWKAISVLDPNAVGECEFEDCDATDLPCRFYRVRTP